MPHGWQLHRVPASVRAVGDVVVGRLVREARRSRRAASLKLRLLLQPQHFVFLFRGQGRAALELPRRRHGPMAAPTSLLAALRSACAASDAWDAGAAVFVERQDRGRLRRQAPAPEGGVEGGGGVADGADVVHGRPRSRLVSGAVCQRAGQGGRGAQAVHRAYTGCACARGGRCRGARGRGGKRAGADCLRCGWRHGCASSRGRRADMPLAPPPSPRPCAHLHRDRGFAFDLCAQ